MNRSTLLKNQFMKEEDSMRKLKFLVAALCFIFTVAGLIFLTACRSVNQEAILNEIADNLTGLSLDVKPATVGLTHASFVLRNDSPYNVFYDEVFQLERMVDGDWESAERINNRLGFVEARYILNLDEIQVITQNWEWLYGALEPGLYRMAKTFRNDVSILLPEHKVVRLTAEFEVLEDKGSDFVFIDITDSPHLNLSIIEYWHPSITGESTSGVIPEYVYPHVGRLDGWVQRTGIIGEDDIGD